MATMAAVPLATASHPQKHRRGKEEEKGGVGGEAPGEEFGSFRNEGVRITAPGGNHQRIF